MSKVHAVLLVPEKGAPHGLLKEGPCGARPPMAWYCSSAQVVPVSCHDPLPGVMTLDAGWHPVPDVYVSAGSRQALVLAWDGKPVAEGLDRLGRTEGREVSEWASVVVVVALAGPSDPDFRDYVGDHELPGTLVLLDAEGREVSDD